MAAHLELTVLVISSMAVLILGQQPAAQNQTATIEEVSVLESKNGLLQMLEKKLKEIKDTRRHEDMPKNTDLKLKSNGMMAVGEADLTLRYGKKGQGTVNMNAGGISNLGNMHLSLGTGEGGLNVPSLNNLFAGSLKSEDKVDQNEVTEAAATTNKDNVANNTTSTAGTSAVEANKVVLASSTVVQ